MSKKDVHYVLVCHGKNCLCQGAPELLRQIKATLGEQDSFRVIPFNCFGACAASPNIAVFPDRLWYSQVAPEHVHKLVSSLLQGQEVSDLSGKVSPDVVDLVFRLLAKPLLKL